MCRVIAWFRSHPLTTGLLLFVGCLSGLHLFANWRAEVRWQRYCTEARARGVKLTLAEFARPEIPDAENFAALPIMRAAFAGGAQTVFKLPRPNGESPPYYNYGKGERIDFKAWAKFFQNAGFISQTTDSAPRDVLLALEHYAPQFKEWGEWRMRPRCQFPPQTDAMGFLKGPSFDVFSNAAQLFTLRMRAHLAVGDSRSALADFEDALQIHRSVGDGTTLINFVLKTGLLAIVCSQFGESLELAAWSDRELDQIQKDLAAVRDSNFFKAGYSGERIGINSFYERLVHSPAERTKLSLLGLTASSASWQANAYMLIPSHVFRENQLRQNQFFDEQVAKTNAANDVNFQWGHLTNTPKDSFSGFVEKHYFFLFNLLEDAIVSVSESGVLLQNKLNQVRLAAGLERFRLARGDFPERLAELVPEFIAEEPLDVFSGHPMIYRRKEGGTFLLYSVGKDGKDDGGQPGALGPDGNRLDQIWLYAPPAR